jgi:regulator of sigma E protease
LANFLLAILVYWIVYSMGVSGIAPVIGSLVPDSVAEQAGLEVGQEIVAVDGEPTPTWQALNEQLVRRIGETGSITFSVKEPGDSLQYEYEGELQDWLNDADEPDPVSGLGIVLYSPQVLPVAEEVVAGEPADKAGIHPGDQIISADGEPMPDWSAWVNYVRARPEQPIALVVQRGDDRIDTTVVPKLTVIEDGSKVGQVGMSVRLPEWPESMIRKSSYGLFEALGQGVAQTWNTSLLILDSVKKMLMGLISAKHLSGPITIAKVAGASAQYGLTAYLGFLAFLSVSLGVLNLLPIPVLDGGHLMYYIIEAVKGTPVPEKVQMVGFRIGMFLVIGLMLLALYNDLMRL